jgi:hypothetical protein
MAKINRNSPCPCGSGKKYKKCCYAQDQKKRTVGSRSRNALFGKNFSDVTSASKQAKERLKNVNVITVQQASNFNKHPKVDSTGEEESK